MIKIIVTDLKPKQTDHTHLIFSNADFPHGPLTIKDPTPEVKTPATTVSCSSITVAVSPGKKACRPHRPKPKAMHLVFKDDFMGPLSISRSVRVRYTRSVKPDADTAEFGEGVFCQF